MREGKGIIHLERHARLPPRSVVVERAVDATAAVVLLQPVPHPPELGLVVRSDRVNNSTRFTRLYCDISGHEMEYL